MHRFKNTLFIAAALSLALFYRLAYVAAVHIDAPLQADAKAYVNAGYNLLNHGVLSIADPPAFPKPDSYRSPGYPLLIALCLAAAGPPSFYTALVAVQVALSVAMVLLTYLLARRFLSFWPALAAAALCALSPHLITMTCYALTETLFGFMLLLSLLLLARALERSSLAWFATAGIAFGYAYLVNETSLLLPFVCVAAIWPRRAPAPGVRRGLVLCLGVFLLFPAGWSARNAYSLEPGAGTGAQRAVTTLSHGAYPDFIYKDPAYQFRPYAEDPAQPEFGSSLRGFASVLSERVKKRPLRYLSWYLLEKPYWLWTWDIQEGQGDVFVYQVVTSLFHENDAAFWTRQAMKWMHPWVVGCALCGLLLLIRGRSRPQHAATPPALLMTYALLCYFTVMYAVFAPWTRYAVPLRPELYLAAVWAVWTLGAAAPRVWKK